MKVSELAKKMGVSRQWLNKMVDRGLVHGVSRSKVTGRLVIAKDEGTEAEFLRNVERFQDALKDATRELAGTVKKLQSIPSHERLAASREFSRMIRTTTLISRLLPCDFEDRFPDEYRACNELPIQEAFKLLRASKPFMNFKVMPWVEWVASARTERSFQMRCAIIEFKEARNPEQFRNQADIAERFGVTRSAVSKAFRQMPPFKRSPGRPPRSPGRSEA
jgi:DNA-binding Lrp family transcriptional regulator